MTVRARLPPASHSPAADATLEPCRAAGGLRPRKKDPLCGAFSHSGGGIRPGDLRVNEPTVLRRGRSNPHRVGGSWAGCLQAGVVDSPVVPGHITPRSQLQSQILPRQEAPSPSQHPTAFLSGRQDLNLRPPGPSRMAPARALWTSSHSQYEPGRAHPRLGAPPAHFAPE